MLKSTLVIIILVLAGLGLASPMIIGANVEARLYTNIERINDMPLYTASVDSYQNSYLNSRAVVSVGINTELMTMNMTPEERVAMQPLLQSLANGFPVTLDIRNGPFLGAPDRALGIFHSRIDIAGDNDLPANLAALLEAAGGAQTTLTMGFTGNGELRFTAPAFDFEEDESRLGFGGASFLADLQDWGLVYSATGAVNESVFLDTSNNNTLTIAPITLAMTGDLRDGFVGATGEFEVDVTRIEAVSATSTFSLDHMTMDTAITSPTEETLDVEYRFGIESLEGSEMEATLRDLVVNFSLRNLDKAAIRAVTDLYMSEEFFTQDPLVIQEALSAAMVETYGSAEYHLDRLAFTYGDDVSLELSGSLTVDSNLFANPALAQNPFMLMSAVNTDITMRFSQGFADLAYEQFLRNQLQGQGMSAQEIEQLITLQQPQLGIMIGQLVQAGTLIATQDGYTMEISLAGGNLLINGAPGNFPFF